jgi:hypothetical protein
MFGIHVHASSDSPDGGRTTSASDLSVDFVTAPPDVERGDLHFESCRKCVHPADALRVRNMPAGGYELWFGDGTWARIDDSVAHVDLYTPALSSVEDSIVYLTGPIIGFVLRLRGMLALHASAVLVDGVAVAFVGTSGYGKSTIAAAFAQSGDIVLTEDLLALEPVSESGQLIGHGGYDYVRLWPDSAALLSESHLAPLTPTWDKLRFPIPIPPLHAPLGLVYLIDRRRAEPALSASSAPIPAHFALVDLVPQTYLPLLLPSQERARELLALGELVRCVPVRRLVVPQLPLGLASLRDIVARDLRSASLARA